MVLRNKTRAVLSQGLKTKNRYSKPLNVT